MTPEQTEAMVSEFNKHSDPVNTFFNQDEQAVSREAVEHIVEAVLSVPRECVWTRDIQEGCYVWTAQCGTANDNYQYDEEEPKFHYCPGCGGSIKQTNQR